MKYKVIQAVNMKAALMAIHRELGPQAFICRSRSTVSGVEVLAGIESEGDEGVPVESKSEMDLKLSEMANMINQLHATINTMHQKKKSISLRPVYTGMQRCLRWLFAKLPTWRRKRSGRVVKYLHSTMSQKMLSIYRRQPVYVPEKGIYALIGTNGSGKTTTIIKLASKFINQYSQDEIGIISCDIDDLYTKNKLYQFCEVYQITYAHANTTEEMRLALQNMKHKRLVLIDTHGVNCRDHLAMKQLANFLSASREKIATFTVIDSNLKEDIIAEQLQKLAFKSSVGCIITKVDTAINPAETIDHLSHSKFKIAFISTGEDLESDIHSINEWEDEEIITRKLG